jgi:hypothetical protein
MSGFIADGAFWRTTLSRSTGQKLAKFGVNFLSLGDQLNTRLFNELRQRTDDLSESLRNRCPCLGRPLSGTGVLTAQRYFRGRVERGRRRP